MTASENAANKAQHALSQDEITEYLARCPPEHRWAFGPYLRGQPNLAGDEIGTGHKSVVPSDQ